MPCPCHLVVTSLRCWKVGSGDRWPYLLGERGGDEPRDGAGSPWRCLPALFSAMAACTWHRFDNPVPQGLVVAAGLHHH